MSLNYNQLEPVSRRIRLEILKLWAANQGPVSGSLSIVDIYAVLFFRILNLEKWADDAENRVRIIPKATAANALYGSLKYAGLLPTNADHQIGFLPPVAHRHRWVGDIDGSLTRSFGQGIGLALFAKYRGLNTPILIFVSEGDLQAGVEQAAKLAASWQLNNLTVVLDNNKVQSSYKAEESDSSLEPDETGRLAKLACIWENYGWAYREIDGHDYSDIEHGLADYDRHQKPTLIVAKTTKGKGVPFIEAAPIQFSHKLPEKEHREAVAALQAEIAEAMLRGQDTVTESPKLLSVRQRPAFNPRLPEQHYDTNEIPLFVFRDWVAAFRDLNPTDVFILNSDNPGPFTPQDPVYSPDVKSQHLQIGVNEKLAINIARGIANAGGLPIYTTPATHIQVCTEDLMHCAVSQDPVLLVGTYPGTDLAHWGPTHNGSRDMILFSFPGVAIFQPATADDTWLLMNGIYRDPTRYLPGYLRLPSRPFTHEYTGKLVRIGFDDAFNIGFYWFGEHSAKRLDVLFVASGITVQECLAAAEQLAEEGMHCAVANILNLTEINKEVMNTLAERSQLIVSCIDADAEVLSNLLWKILKPSQRHKLTARGTGNSTEHFFSRPDTLAAHGIDAEHLASFVSESLKK